MLAERLGHAPADICASYLRAFQARPTRAEPLVELARYHRLRGEHALAFIYAQHAASLPRPSDGLFVDEAAYAWRALDEVAIAAFYAGRTTEGRDALQRLLTDERVPLHERPRLVANGVFYGLGSV